MSKERMYKKRGYWYVWGKNPDGTKWAKSTGFREQYKKEAVKEAQRITRLVYAGYEAKGKPSQTLAECLDNWIREKKAHSAPSTAIRCQTHATNLLRLLGNVDIASIGVADVDLYSQNRRSEGVSRSTIYGEIHFTLCASFNHARRLGLYHSEPITIVPKAYRGAMKTQIESYTDREFRLLIEACKERLPKYVDYFLCYGLLGIRVRELFSIKAEDVNLETEMVFIAGTKTKKSRRWIPIPVDALPIFERRLAKPFPGGYLFKPTEHPVQQIGWALRKVCEHAGLRYLKPKALRATFATLLIGQGASNRIVASMMGHVNSAIIDRHYGDVTADAQRAAVALMPPVAMKAPEPSECEAAALRREVAELRAMLAIQGQVANG